MHYINRTCIFPLRIRGGKPTAAIPFLLATAFCSANGYVQARTLCSFQSFPEGHELTPRFVAGVLLFCVGFAINYQADDILRNLRKPGETGYKIPRGGMFEYVSGANFFGEILEWSGFALASGSLPAVAFATATTFNIGPRARQHHLWYLTKFDDYPKDRVALIPFVW